MCSVLFFSLFMTDLEMSCQQSLKYTQSCVQYFSFLLTMMTDLEMSISPDACISLLNNYYNYTYCILLSILGCMYADFDKNNY